MALVYRSTIAQVVKSVNSPTASTLCHAAVHQNSSVTLKQYSYELKWDNKLGLLLDVNVEGPL